MKITFPLLLGTVFVVLKLTHVIAWSWWWVTCPFWLPMAIAALFGLVYLVLLAFESEEARKNRHLREALKRYGNALKR